MPSSPVTRDTSSDSEFRTVYQVVEGYYTSTLALHGATPLGVDWSCGPTQDLRFVKLLNVCDFGAPFSLNDIGCGYGALLDYLRRNYTTPAIDYLGLDLSAQMIFQARNLRPSDGHSRFSIGNETHRIADYSIASGIFNVKLHTTRDHWEDFIEHTLNRIRATSRRGFAVNFLRDLPEPYVAPSALYRSRAEPWSSFCRDQYSADVEILTHHAGREFTLLIRY